ncbi:hypothetical protein G6F59_016654 [Rhizopus arrhizus]|nr:hypothetical protein G6F59_016654 [Rhizopus arrhizus]
MPAPAAAARRPHTAPATDSCVGAAQPGKEAGALSGRGLVSDQRGGRGRDGRIEQPDQAACTHQHQHRPQYRRHRLQSNIDEHRQRDVDHGVGTHRQHQHALAANAVAELPPRARSQHPQHARRRD